MKTWNYSWQDADGLRHEGEIFADNKDAAYAALREKGIRPIRVTERIVPIVRRGIRGLRKREIFAFVLVVFVIAAIAWVVSAISEREKTALPNPSVDAILSDPGVQEEMRRAIEDRKRLETECRERFVKRVKEGSLTKEEANRMFRAMGMEELK